MKIAFFEIEEWEKPYIKDKLSEYEIVFFNEPLTSENVQQVKDAESISIFIYTHLTKELIDQMPQLKLITTRSTGFDHIDVAHCKEKKIVVCTVPEYGTHTVAEHAFALLLAISRKLLPSIEQARKADYNLDNLRGFDLFEKTLGVIGAGHIGQTMIKIAHGFGMNVIAYTHHPDEQLAKTLGFRFVSLDDVLAQSDVVTLHLPLTPQTEHIINKENIVKFKKGAVLLNTARGGLIDTEALLIGLEEGFVQAAGIDVLEEECYVKEERQLLTETFLKECNMKTQLLNHVLLANEKVLVTPHNAFNSTEALQRILDVTVGNILAYHHDKIQNAL